MTHRLSRIATGTVTLAVLLAPAVASAHPQAGVARGFATGFLHPLSGLDHIAAMVAVGLWGAQLGAPAIWLLPVTFPLVMAFGGFLGLIGVPLPGIEIGIALSGIVLGLMIVFSIRPPLSVAAVVVGVFAICHGHAHGAELGGGGDAVAYSVGFVIATGLLHLCGITIGLIHRWAVGRAAVRVAGAAIASAGVFFLTEAMRE